MTYSDGGLLEGRWDPPGVLQSGTLRFSSGDEYDGSFSNGLRHGHGRYRWSGGSTYSGEWKEGKIHGFGVYDWPGGSHFEGNWEAGLRAGYGKAHRERAHACLAQVGMADLAGRQIGALSGGQQQRVLVARALAQDAELFILDEPFANIDAFTETSLAEVLRGLRDRGRTILAVHHDLRSVRTHFDDAILLSHTIVAQGAVAQVMTDATLARAYGFHAEDRAEDRAEHHTEDHAGPRA
jgi:ABC-type dipeptide/oligopeptide/nickel transport system ATPase component